MIFQAILLRITQILCVYSICPASHSSQLLYLSIRHASNRPIIISIIVIIIVVVIVVITIIISTAATTA